MAQRTAIGLTGDDLVLADVWAVAVDGAHAQLTDEARTKMRAARELVERAAHGAREHTYGVNTGFGRFVSKTIPEELTGELQLRLLRSHACGVGEPYPDEIVRAAMLLRANALAKGYSGARVETVELLVECLNRGVVPHVPSRGSVGASGDLAPLAHLALPLVGEGEAAVEGERLPGSEALAAVGLEPLTLVAKEGLSLVNGTQFMAAFGALGLARARRLARAADLACALSLEALQGSRTSFLPQIHALRPLRGQGESAANVLRLLEDSAIIESHRWCDKVQDAYSLRCAPQVHGASRDLLAHVEATIAVELNAATDNPLVLLDEGEIVSAGNFHGQPLGFAADMLAMAVAEVEVGEIETVELGEERVELTAVSVGNPHAVVEGDPGELPRIGPLLETHPRFPERTNVQVARIDGPGLVTARVWERGVGETRSSGTGACGAAVAFALSRGGGGAQPVIVTVQLDGGELEVVVSDSLDVDLTGWAVPVYRGELSEELVAELRGG